MKPHAIARSGLSSFFRPSLLALVTWVAACAKPVPVSDLVPAAPPELGAPKAFVPALPQQFTIPSGTSVWLVEKPGLPLVSLRLVLPGGALLDPAAQPGLTAMADEAAMRGAGARDALQFAQEVDRLALSLAIYTGKSSSILAIDCHADRLPEALAILSDILERPRFDQPMVDTLKTELQSSLVQALDDPRTVAGRITDQVWYGEGHPYARPVSGTPATIAPIQRDALLDNWKRRADPRDARLVVTGAVDAAKLQSLLSERLGNWKAGAMPLHLPAVPAAPAVAEGPRLALIDNPGAAQTVLRVVYPGPGPTDAGMVPTQLGTLVLGGTFTSRLNRLLREEKGYTYGARAALELRPGQGRIVASTNVFADQTGPALADLLAELNRAKAGIDAAELAKAIASNQSDRLGGMEDRASLADTYTEFASLGLKPEQLPANLQAAGSTPEAAVDTALGALDLNKAWIVVNGDLAKVRPGVLSAVEKATGRAPKPVVLNPDGTVVTP